MADNNPVPPQAIPPKAMPPTQGGADAPTVRRQPVPVEGSAMPSVAPSAAPRTVRLKPVQVPVPGAATPVAPSPPPPSAGGALAAEAIKRMTSRIPMPSSTGPIGGKGSTGQIPAASASGGFPGAKRATAPLPVEDAADAEGGVKKVTSRIPMPSSTAAIPAVADAPKTIKIKPLVGPQTVPGTQPVPAVGEAAQPQASKSKTSRIPLEAAMGIPQTGDGGVPKTIKLKRPGEMSTVKVSVAGPGTASEQDVGAITQRKTIRVKRPTAPAITVPAEGAENEAASVSPVAFKPAPERGAGPFVAVAVLCILVTLGLLVVFSAQIFGPNASLTQVSIWPGIDIPLPGSIPAEG